MTAARKPLGVATRRAVTRILGSADSLPDRSKASKVLTIVACRLQLFVCELERARYEHFGLGIEQLLDRLHEHSQLLGVASLQGGGVQSGYALLSELSELLQGLESSVLLLPGQLGSDARYKPALDELQALLSNVSYYRLECEDTKRRMELALSDLVQSCCASGPDRNDGTPATAATMGQPTQLPAAGLCGCAATAATMATAATATGTASSAAMAKKPITETATKRNISSSSSDVAALAVNGAAALPDVAVLQRVRQVICSLDLDVEMAERDQELDAELLQLRRQMQQALQQQQKMQPEQKPQPQQQMQQQDLKSDKLGQISCSVRQGALVRSGARRRREPPSGSSAAGAAAAADLPIETPSGSSSLSWSTSSLAVGSISALSPPLPYGSGGSSGATVASASRASRLHAARHISRSLAAQHLAKLKEQQRQLRLQHSAAAASVADADSGANDDDTDLQPTVRRQKVLTDPSAAGPAALVGAETAGMQPQNLQHGKNCVAAADGAVVTWRGFADTDIGVERIEVPGSRVASGGGGSSGSSSVSSLRKAHSANGSGTDSDPRGRSTAAAAAAVPAAMVNGVPHGLDPPPSSAAAATAEAVTASEGKSSRTGDDTATGGSIRGGGGTHAAVAPGAQSSPPPQQQQQQQPQSRRPTEASVMALRKLNRVTTLAGLWEAGRPVAQQSNENEEEAEEVVIAVADEDGGASDCDDRSNGSDASGGAGDHELPARPAPPPPPSRRLAVPAPPSALPPSSGDHQVHRTAVALAVANHSPFLVLAMQGRAPKAPPPPVLGRLLAPLPELGATLEETSTSPATPHDVDGGGGSADAPTETINSLPYPPAVGAAGTAAAGGPPLRVRGAGPVGGGGVAAVAAATAAMAAAPAPLPLPEASVHLRAVGLPGCFGSHWVPPGPFGLPAAAHAAGGGLWLMDAGGGGDDEGGGGGGGGGELLNFGPDVPTLDLHRDITGWGPCLGRGAFGAVYKAVFRNKPAAVKVLHGGALDVRDVRSLTTEISMLCRLRHHPNIITVYGAAAAPPDHVALVTELMDCDLYDYIHRRRQNCVPLDEVLSIARAIASGLSELHPTIVHRDLKPANVLLKHSAPPPAASPTTTAAAAAAAMQQQQLQGLGQQRLTVKIADFGLARHKRSQYLSTRERDVGTLKYMAPECIASGGGGSGGTDGGGEGGAGGINEKCDIYSFGVLLYELVTGKEPWEGCHPLYAMCQVQSGATLQLPEDPSRCPPALRALVQRCWAHPHHQRPSSRELLQLLDELIATRQQQQGGGNGH